jgi:hypothetical protein
MTFSNLEAAAETLRSLAEQVCEEQQRQHVWTASLMIVDFAVAWIRKITEASEEEPARPASVGLFLDRDIC